MWSDPYVEAQNYQTWLKVNGSHFHGYTLAEIARVAIFCGFSFEVVCPETTDYAVRLMRRLRFWDSPLSSYWVDLQRYERGRGFDE